MKNLKRIAIACSTAVIFVALTPSVANAAEAPPEKSYDTKVMSGLISTSKLTVELLKSHGGFYEAAAGLATVSIPKNPEQPVSIFYQNEPNAVLVKASVDSINPKQYVEKNTVVTQDKNMFIGLQVVDGGIQQIAYIKNNAATRLISVNYSTKGSAHLAFAKDNKGRTDGSVALFEDAAENNPILFMPVPSVKDANGKPVRIHYQIEDHNLVQLIDQTSNVEYPIVSTFTSIGTFFSSDGWIYRSPMWSLSLVPNSWFRVAGGLSGVAEEIVNRQAWNQIYAKHHANGHWRDRNVNGMFNQYECHFHFGFWKSAFNIEPDRPNPDFGTYLKTRCNP